MTNQELFEIIQRGELPQAGIICRTSGAKHIKVTTVHNGERVDVLDVDLTKGGDE